MCCNDELSLTMSWIGCLLTDSGLPDTYMKVKRVGITEILRRIWLFSANKIKSSESFSKQSTQLIFKLNSSLRHIIVTFTFIEYLSRPDHNSILKLIHQNNYIFPTIGLWFRSNLSPNQNSKPNVVIFMNYLKVALSQKILENFYISNIDIPNHNPEQKIWISRLK